MKLPSFFEVVTQHSTSAYKIYLPAATHRVGEGPWKAMLLRPSMGIRANSQPTFVVRYSAKYPSWQPRQGYSTGSVKLAVEK